MIKIDKEILDKLFEQAKASERKRMNYDLRTSKNDSSQRMLNALMPETCVPIHRHPHSNENVMLLCGKIVEVLYEDSPSLYPRFPQKGKEPHTEDLSISPKGEGELVEGELVEVERCLLDPSVGKFGCVVPANTWHTVEVLEPSVIYEAKDGKYGFDGSESYDDCIEKQKATTITNNCIGDLKKNIEYLIGMERHSGSMEVITPLYVSRMLNVPLQEVERAMQEMKL